MAAKAIDLLMGQNWAIRPDFLQTMAKIALRKGDDLKDIAESIIRAGESAASPLQAGKAGAPLQYTRQSEVRDGVAIINVAGPLFSKANMMTAHSGASSYHNISHDLAVAVENPSIRSIILNVDSPGGIAFGPSELAEEIQRADAIKPVVVYVSGLCCSAAYWIAAGARAIVAHHSSILGSIGVVAAASYQEKPDMNGDMWLEIVSSNAKNKRPDVRSEEGRAEIQKELDDLESEFHRSISVLRGVSREQIITDFGSGGVLIAAEAVRVGMADRLGSFEDLLKEMSNGTYPQKSQKGERTMNKKAETEPSKPEDEEVKEVCPTCGRPLDEKTTITIEESSKKASADLAVKLAAARNEGLEAGKKAERDRIAAIESVALAGHEDLVAAAKADGKTTAAELSQKIIAAEKSRGGSFLSQQQEAAGKQPQIDPSASNDQGNDPAKAAANDKTLPVEERAKASWDSDEKVRAEFRTFDAYLGWFKGDEAKRIRTKK